MVKYKKVELELDREKFVFEAKFHWLIFIGTLLLSSILGYYAAVNQKNTIAMVVLGVFMAAMTIAMIMQSFNVRSQFKKVDDRYNKLIGNKMTNKQASLSEKRNFWLAVMASFLTIMVLTAGDILGILFGFNHFWSNIFIFGLSAIAIFIISTRYFTNTSRIK